MPQATNPHKGSEDRTKKCKSGITSVTYGGSASRITACVNHCSTAVFDRFSHVVVFQHSIPPSTTVRYHPLLLFQDRKGERETQPSNLTARLRHLARTTLIFDTRATAPQHRRASIITRRVTSGAVNLPVK